jgi:hypothetical protein
LLLTIKYFNENPHDGSFDGTFIALRGRSLEKNVSKAFLFALEEYFHHNHQFLLHSGLQLSLLNQDKIIK